MNEKSAKDGKSARSTNATAKHSLAEPANVRRDEWDRPAATESLMMRREVRIGVAVLAVLLFVFAYVFVHKINQNSVSTAPLVDASDDGEPAADEAPTSDPPPTVVTAEVSHSHIHSRPPEAPGRLGTYAGELPRDDLAPRSTSFLPPRGAVDEATANSSTRYAGAANDGANDGTNDGTNDGASDAESVPLPPNGVAEDAGRYSRYLEQDSRHTNAAETTVDSSAIAAQRYVDRQRTPDSVVADRDTRRRHHSDDIADDIADTSPRAEAADANLERPQPVGAAAIQATPVVKDSPRPAAVAASQPSVADGAPSAAGESPRNRTYVTVTGDTPAAIAERLYGDARYAAALLAYNGVDLVPDVVVNPGGEVLVPPLADLRREFGRLIPAAAMPATADVAASSAADRPTAPRVAGLPAETPAADAASRREAPATRIYIVERGESVYDIARKQLGRVSRWRDILELNQDQLGGDIDAIAPGMRLRLPDEGRSQVARQRGELQWR